ncbi:MAG: FAD:protein FMN transferase [Muribaculaceae bacterium]|nr:FAD:protein FMN transferase [Muribaculaceae bacterium]
MNFTQTAAAVFASIILLSSCSKEGYRHDEGMVWHTSYHITYRSDSDLTDSIVAVFREVGGSLNVFDPGSLASRVNLSDSVEIDDNYARVYEMSCKINRISGGAFDPTLGPLITAWGFGKGHSATRDTLRIDSLLGITGLTKTHLSGKTLIKGDRRIEFNYSAIAKGFGCDKVGEMLARNGVTDYLVEIGGEIYCSGKSPSGGNWRISVDRPVVSDSVIHESQCIVELTNKGLATSGNYRNFHRDASGIYGHTISARTGRPARTNVLSASVIASTAMEADALATSMMAMGSVEAERIAKENDMAVMLVLADSTVWTSDAFNDAIVSVP